MLYKGCVAKGQVLMNLKHKKTIWPKHRKAYCEEHKNMCSVLPLPGWRWTREQLEHMESMVKGNDLFDSISCLAIEAHMGYG